MKQQVKQVHDRVVALEVSWDQTSVFSGSSSAQLTLKCATSCLQKAEAQLDVRSLAELVERQILDHLAKKLHVAWGRAGLRVRCLTQLYKPAVQTVLSEEGKLDALNTELEEFNRIADEPVATLVQFVKSGSTPSAHPSGVTWEEVIGAVQDADVKEALEALHALHIHLQAHRP